MLIIGSHVNFTNKEQLLGCLHQSLEYGSNAFMFYTGAPQNTARSNIDDSITEKAIQEMKKHGISLEQVIVHAPYIINLANNSDEGKYRFSIRFLKEEIRRCEQIGIHYLVLHPGSHVGLGIEKGIENIVRALNEVNESNHHVIILLETMAGKGTEVGSNFEEIHALIDGIQEKEKIGVCLDTCHLNDSGYFVADFDHLLREFDEKVGLSYVHCVHVNDSKNPRGSKKDRHENIGFGTIGFDSLIKVIYNKRLENIPKILETPWVEDQPPYQEEIQMIKDKKMNEKLKEIVASKKEIV